MLAPMPDEGPDAGDRGDQRDGGERAGAGAADQVRLVLPAEPEYGRLARITTAGLAVRSGYSFAAIEDLRLAVDETIILLLRPEGDPGKITLVFTVERDRLTIDASTTAGRSQHWVDDGALAHFEAIVDDIVDLQAVDPDGHRVHLEKKLS
jgi:hypothetical protein